MGRGKREAKKQAMARVAIVEAALREFDPLGVSPRQLAPADEYDSYAPHIVSLVARGCTVDELEQHLRGFIMSDIEPRVSSRVIAEKIHKMLHSE